MTATNTPGKILKFILIAIALGLFGVAMGFLGGLFAGRVLGDGSLTDLGLAILGLLLGYVCGIVVGVIAIKYVFHQRGSIIFGIIGAIIWTGISILVMIPFNLNDNLVSVFVTACFLGVPFAALGGFYLKR